MTTDYPWYIEVNGGELQQGDILRDYPVFYPEPFEIPDNLESDEMPVLDGGFIKTDVLVVSQSCDLVNNKVDTVILCPLHCLNNIKATFGESEKAIRKRSEDIRQGKEPGFHMIGGDTDLGLEISIVEFRRILTTPKPTLLDFANKAGDRVRLLPPYREHLSQAFARYFMRVGLPEDIPRFG